MVQAATAGILLVAANTSFADFPRLASLMSRDRFLPSQFAHLGDRLVYSNGIIALASFAAILVFAFRGDTSRLIPLYAVGVFLSFTLSQAGMVVHWWHQRQGDAERSRGSDSAESAESWVEKVNRDQCPGRVGDGAGGGDLRAHEVRSRRLDRGGLDPGSRADFSHDS